MPKKSIDLVTHIFKGARFDDHGLDIDALQELIAYKKLLIETAKEIWRRENPEKQKLKSNFEDSLCIKFYKLEEGSTAIPLKRMIEYDQPELPFDFKDELDEAVELIAEASEASSNDKPLPENFPKNVIPLFGNYGKTLREGESFEQKPAERVSPALYCKPARYTSAARERLTKWIEREYEDLIEITGEVRAADLDGCNFNLRIDDKTKIPGKFTSEQESTIIDALHEHTSQRLRVKGQAVFSHPDGKIKRITSVDELILQQGGEIQYDPTARPIWEIAAELSATIPDEEWAKLPSDLSKNLDHYLYGAHKEEE